MADVNVTITIPDAHVSRVVNAFKDLADKQIKMMVHGDDFRGDWDFTYEAQAGGETTLAFGKRVIVSLIRAVVRLYDYAEDRERYNTAISAVAPPTQDVPDSIVG